MTKKKYDSYDIFFKDSDIKVPQYLHFFNKLMLTPKPNIKKATNIELLNWYIKTHIGYYYFKLGQLHLYFLTWLTQYWPFSLLYTDKLFHAKNKNLKKFVNKLEKMVAKHGVKMLIKGNRYENDMVVFTALFENKPNQTKLIKFENELQKMFGSVYVRKENQNINIIFPKEVLLQCLAN